MNLTLSQPPPNFSQIANSSFNTGATLTQAVMQALARCAKFAAVRTEEFYGYYINGQTVVLPVSPIDGYSYARSELSYLCSAYWTGAMLPDTFGSLLGDAGIDADGGLWPTARGYATGPGQLVRVSMTVNQSTGAVTTSMTYGGSSTSDGVVLVTTIARRMR
ncbi:MAG: hypothetical protein KGL39_11555 [Patescibacteria group bacterium]|nr:hypothetical protein [Patescibacteria group bacterium]